MILRIKSDLSDNSPRFKDLNDWEYFRWPSNFLMRSPSLRVKIPRTRENANTIDLTNKIFLCSSDSDFVVRVKPEDIELVP